MADDETTRAMMKAAGFDQVDFFKRIDADICIGNSVEEAIDYQLVIGSSGEIIREAGRLAEQKLPIIREQLTTLMEKQVREDGGVYMPSSTCAISATKR